MTVSVAAMRANQLSAFSSIWIPWLRSTVGVTPQEEDLRAMEDPLAFYGETGGSVFLASLAEKIVGAVAVKGLDTAGSNFANLSSLTPLEGMVPGARWWRLALNMPAHMVDPIYTFSLSESLM